MRASLLTELSNLFNNASLISTQPLNDSTSNRANIALVMSSNEKRCGFALMLFTKVSMLTYNLTDYE